MKDERPRWAGLNSRRLLTDLGLALLVTVVLVVASQQELRRIPGAPPLDPEAFVLLAGSGLVLVARRFLPLATYIGSLGFASLYLLAGHPPGPIYAAPFIALLTVVSLSRLVVWTTSAIVGAALLTVAPVGTGGTWLSAAIWAGVWQMLAGLFALWLMIRRRFVAEARARADLAKRNEAAEGRRRTAEERLSIAREMHV
jgi:signal transduction histidine kinase